MQKDPDDSDSDELDGDGSGNSDSEGSVSRNIKDARLGRVIAIERLTEIYLNRLESFASDMLSGDFRRVEDEEDVAIRVLAKFFDGFLNGRFEGLKNRHQLWRLLAKMTVNRVIDHYEKYTAQKRDIAQTESAADPFELSASILDVSIDEIDPQLSSMLRESYQAMLQSLPDQINQKIVRLHLEGLDPKQIGRLVRLSERQVRNRLEAIRRLLVKKLKH